MKRKSRPGEVKRAKIETTADGRILGDKTIDLVPKHLRNIIPKKAERKNKSAKDKAGRKVSQQFEELTRGRLPLAMSPDGEVLLGQKKTRIRGLNQAKFNCLIAALSHGNTIAGACKLAGIAPTTLQIWVRKGRENQYPYNIFVAAYEEAMELATQKALDTIYAAMKNEMYIEVEEEEAINEHNERSKKSKIKQKQKLASWQAAAWLLERRDPSFRLDKGRVDDGRVDDGQEQGNTKEQDLIAMDAVSLGVAINYTSDEQGEE